MKRIRKYWKSISAIVMAVCLGLMALPQTALPVWAATRSDSSGMALGSDISAAADADKSYNNKDGESKKLYDICSGDYGMNVARLRTWVNHRRGSCSEDSIIAYAKQCKAAGLDVMIDFHYADDWADPGKQPAPSVWNVTDDISFEEAQRVGQELYDYTYEFLTHMQEEGVTPKWVQVGNEITNGMIWPLCNIANYENFTYVLQKGIDAVRDASPETKVVIHIDNGASTETVISWFERLVKAGVTDFDVMGLSFYPSDHDPTSSIESLANTFEGLYNEFCVGTDREIMVVEIGANYLSNATTNQKYNMIVNVINELKAIPDGRGAGCIYWEIENYEMEGGKDNGKPNKVWEAFSTNAQLVNENPVTAISLEEGEALELEINDVHQLQVNVEPEQPDITRMVYTSSNPEVCTVSGGGQIKALGIGESTITVSNYGGTNGEYETFTQTLKVTVTEEKPGLKNGGFELGDNGIWKYDPDNVGTPTLGTSANSLSGSSSLHFTGGSGDVDFTFYQDINGLAPGKYRLTGYVMGDTGVTSLNLFAQTTDEKFTSELYNTIGWGGSDSFVKMTLEDIEVLDGKLRVGAHAAATYTGSESWGDFDDFTLELVEAYDIPEESDSEARIALQNLYDSNKDLEQGSYTDTSYQAFKEALAAAADILANEDVTDAELTAAYDLLSETIGGLVEVEKTDEPEKKDKPGKTDSEARAALQNLYNASKDLVQGKYTNDSYAAFTKALKVAETVLSDEDATDTELTEAYNALTDAIAGLKEDASAEKTSSVTAVKTGDTAQVAIYVLLVLIAFGIVLSAMTARHRYRR